MSENEYPGRYTTFGGCDIRAVFADKIIGDIRAIPISISRKPQMYTFFVTPAGNIFQKKETPNERNKRLLNRKDK
jgi:hypothetical protein